MMRAMALAAFGILGIFATSAQAASGPILVFSVPGAVNSAGMGTYITCTALTAQSITATMFNASGNAAGTATLSVAANASVTFGTTSASAFVVNSSLGSPNIDKGYVEISSTSKSVICSALIADIANSPPSSMASLPVISHTKQKGQ